MKKIFKLINNAVFEKNIENMTKHTDIKLVTTERRKHNFVSESNYYFTKFFAENLLKIEMTKTQILIKKPVFSGLSILELSKILKYEFWYDYIKPKSG